MEVSTKKDGKDDILKFLEGYPELKMQYLFFNCFIISSDEINSL